MKDNIGFSTSNNIALYSAYKENGILTIQVGAPSGVVGVLTGKIDINYAPSKQIYDIISYHSSSNDVGKIASASINPNGSFAIWGFGKLAYYETIQFMYPLKSK